MPRSPGALLLTALLALTSGATAAEPASNGAPSVATPAASGVPSAAAPGAKTAPTVAGPVRRDAKGIKGISPFFEALKKGDDALIARDFDAAVAAYREAIIKDPQNALGHYRVGEAQIAKGDVHEAEEAFVNGLRFVSPSNAALKAKLQFSLADLRERQKTYDEAIAKWTEYEAFSTEAKVGFPTSATARKKALEIWKKMSADSIEVKARIDKGLKDADEAVRKSSK
jgi:tetratricopeptide (TPR) repeat protein